MRKKDLKELLPALTSISKTSFPTQAGYIQCLNQRATNQLCCAVAEIVHGRGSLKLTEKKTNQLREIMKPYKKELKLFTSSKSGHLRREKTA